MWKSPCNKLHITGGSRRQFAACDCADGHSFTLNLADSAAAPSQNISDVRRTALQAVFGGSVDRRAVLRALGVPAALAVLETMMPLSALEAVAQEKRTPEKTELSIGFIAISCCTPLVIADNLGLFRENGLDVELVRTPGWGAVRERLQNEEYEGSHVLSTLPIAMSMGVRGTAFPTALALIQNTNGNSLTLALKHKDKRDPKNWKGMTFAVPFDMSMQDLLLRYYVAEQGINPTQDITIKSVPPPEMVANLKAGIIDGFLAPDNVAQMAVHTSVGFIHTLSRDLWNGHPCCGFGVSEDLVKNAPNTFLALTRAVAMASDHASKAENRKSAAAIIAKPKYVNAPVEAMEAVLTGSFDDGLGNHRNVPDRIDFHAFPYQSMAVWMMTQMKRWGEIPQDASYKQIAEKVFHAVDAQKLFKEAELPVPAAAYGKHDIMGKPFDANNPDGYLNSFTIRKT